MSTFLIFVVEIHLRIVAGEEHIGIGDRNRDFVCSGGPLTQIYETAAVAAKRELDIFTADMSPTGRAGQALLGRLRHGF